jgi:hypothetical protein
MTNYEVSYQSEEELVESLGIDASTRVVTDASANRVKYTTKDGVVEMYFDEGFDEPFHVLMFERDAPFKEMTWKSSAELHEKWEEGARTAAVYLSQVTELTPMVWVGDGSDDALAANLTDGYDFILTVDSWPLWVDDLRIKVDASGVASLHTDELPYGATAKGSIDCRSKAEIDALIAHEGLEPLGSLKLPPILYGFDTDTKTLSPFVLVTSSDGEGGPRAVPLDRTKSEF